MSEINSSLVRIIAEELGKNTADLFVEFYKGFPVQEQVVGARDVLKVIIGESRTDELLLQFISHT